MFKVFAVVVSLMLSSCAPAHMASREATTAQAAVNPELTARVPFVMIDGSYWTQQSQEAPATPAYITGEYYFEIDSDYGPTLMRPVYIRPVE